MSKEPASVRVLRTGSAGSCGAQPASAGQASPPLRELSSTARAETEAESRGGPPSELWAALHLPETGTQEELTSLAACLQRYTPRVSLAPPDGLLLEVRGSLHLFAGVAGLRARLTRECLQRKLRPVLAFAPTPLAALSGARAGRPLEVLDPAQLVGQLAPVPLSALRWPQEARARLERLGVRTVGAVLRLPRAGFARRFGPDLLAELDRLTGRAPDVRTAFQPRARFRRRRELECEPASLDLLQAMLAPLFAELGAFLAARQCGVTELEGRFAHRQRQTTRCLLQLAAPCADAGRLSALFGERLQALRLPAAVRACELRARALVPHGKISANLWQSGEQGGCPAGEDADLIERLCARLGAGAVHGLALLEGHRPEHAWALTAPALRARSQRQRQALPAPDRHAGGRASPTPPRPLWLLAAPQPLAVLHSLPRWRGPLRLTSEPERIESGWWDGYEVARDYYTAVDSRGVRLWIFRERATAHGWFLHGVFG